MPELRLHVMEPSPEPRVGLAQRHVRMHPELARQVGPGEEDVAQLVLDGLDIAGGHGLLELGLLLAQLLPHPGGGGPVEPHPRGVLLVPVRLVQRRLAGGEVLEHGFRIGVQPLAPLLLGLDLVPPHLALGHVLGRVLTEHVGMPPDELLVPLAGDVVQRGGRLLGQDPRHEADHEQQIPELLAHVVGPPHQRGLEHLGGLVLQVMRGRAAASACGPRAAAGRPQGVDGLEQGLDVGKHVDLGVVGCDGVPDDMVACRRRPVEGAPDDGARRGAAARHETCQSAPRDQGQARGRVLASAPFPADPGSVSPPCDAWPAAAERARNHGGAPCSCHRR